MGETQMKSKKFLLAFIILTVLFGYRCGKKNTVPEELLGVWKTSAPKYKDCFLELTKVAIIFKTAEGEDDYNNIKSIKKKKIPNEKCILYTISYLDRERQEFKFPIYYDLANNGVIRFKNQPRISWTKEKR